MAVCKHYIILSLFFYSMLSFLGFVLTSSGWTAFLFYGLFEAFFFVANGIFVSVFLFIKKPARLRLPFYLTATVFVLQAAALLLNIGDYGDNMGGRSFFEVLAGRSYFACRGDDCRRPPLLGDMAGHLSILSILIYALFLLFLEAVTLKKAPVDTRAGGDMP